MLLIYDIIHQNAEHIAFGIYHIGQSVRSERKSYTHAICEHIYWYQSRQTQCPTNVIHLYSHVHLDIRNAQGTLCTMLSVLKLMYSQDIYSCTEGLHVALKGDRVMQRIRLQPLQTAFPHRMSGQKLSILPTKL